MSENGISFPDLPIVYIFFTKPLSKKDFDYLVSKLNEIHCDINNNFVIKVRKYIDQKAKVYKKGGVK